MFRSGGRWPERKKAPPERAFLFLAQCSLAATNADPHGHEGALSEPRGDIGSSKPSDLRASSKHQRSSGAHKVPEHPLEVFDIAFLRKPLEYAPEALLSEAFGEIVVSEEQFKLRG